MRSLEYELMRSISAEVKEKNGLEILGNVRHGRLIFPANEDRQTVKALKCTFNPNLLEQCSIVEIPANLILSYIKSIGYSGYAYYDDGMLTITVQK